MSEDALHEVCMELAGISGELRELIEIESGQATAIPKRFYVDAVNNPRHWRTQKGMFHSVKVDNPTGQVLAVAFAAGGAAKAGNAGADELVPAHSGRIITRPFDYVEFGFDPAAVPAGISPLYVTLYARQLQPASYAFV